MENKVSTLRIEHETEIDPVQQEAASQLVGRTVGTGWKVLEIIERQPGRSGGNFSFAYLVKKEGRVGFLKALDFSSAFEDPDKTMERLKDLTTAYEHERQVLEICRDKRLSKVVVAIEDGHVDIPGYGQFAGRVYFLIFERADGDVRGQVDGVGRLSTQFSLRCVRDVCLALLQIHKQMIAHLDVKPSNVLVYGEDGKDGYRVADFGRSIMPESTVYYGEKDVAGDHTYAPPELLYGYRHSEFAVRRFGCDLYMLGNMIAFMFGGVNVTASIASHLVDDFKWQFWQKGEYEKVLPYVKEAFASVLEELKASVDPLIVDDVVELVSQLCDPDPLTRGHPKGLGKHDQYSLERYLSRLDLMSKRFDVMRRT